MVLFKNEKFFQTLKLFTLEKNRENQLMSIEDTNFGSITIDGKKYTHDIVIYPDHVEKRKKWITKQKHGTSHKFTQEEMSEYINNVDSEEIKVVVVGTGQYGKLKLLNETREYLKEKEIEVIELKTPEAIKYFEKRAETRKQKIGIFHVTC